MPLLDGQTKNHSLYYWVKWYHAVRKIRGMFENWKVSILYRLFPFCIKSPVEKFLWKVNVSPYIILSHLLSNKGSDSHISDLIWPWSDLNAGCDTGDDLTDKGDRVDPGVRLITWHIAPLRWNNPLAEKIFAESQPICSDIVTFYDLANSYSSCEVTEEWPWS